MTLVGPRPYLPREKEDMGEYYDDVINNKPGLTGLWFDFKIIMWTVVSVFQSKGAR